MLAAATSTSHNNTTATATGAAFEDASIMGLLRNNNAKTAVRRHRVFCLFHLVLFLKSSLSQSRYQIATIKQLVLRLAHHLQ